MLEASETLTGTPTVTVSPTGPTLGSKIVNVAAIDVNGDTVAIGEAVQFTVTGGTAGVRYTITASCGTSSSQTLVGTAILVVE